MRIVELKTVHQKTIRDTKTFTGNPLASALESGVFHCHKPGSNIEAGIKAADTNEISIEGSFAASTYTTLRDASRAETVDDWIPGRVRQAGTFQEACNRRNS